MKCAEQLLAYLEERASVLSPLLIITHNYPDPDSISSAFALQYLAKKYHGITSRIVYGGVISSMENRSMVRLLKIPIYKIKPGDLRRYSNIALVDTQPAFENNPVQKTRQPAIVIDQHQSDIPAAGDCVLIDTACGATCVILAQALFLLKDEIPSEVATALIYGILTDTLNFYRSAKREVFDVYLELLPYCNMQQLVDIQNTPRPRQFFSAFRLGLERACVFDTLVYTHLGDINDPIYIAHVADFILRYKGMKWSFCSGRHKNRLYFSLRAAGVNAQASRMLQDVVDDKAQAGGHGMIAGGSKRLRKNAPDTDWISAEEEIVQRLIRRLRMRKKTSQPFT